LADYDGDGWLDIISGSNCCDYTTLHYFPGRPDGTFGDRVSVTTKFLDPREDRFLMRGRNRYWVTDWNRDGTPDLVAMLQGGGSLAVALGPLAGQTEITQFRKVELPIDDIWLAANPVVADWDRDGRPDLIVGLREKAGSNWDGVYWFRNTATAGEPRFDPPVPITTTYRGAWLQHLTVGDWDGDGWLDLITTQFVRRKLIRGGNYEDIPRIDLYRRTPTAG